MVDEGDKRWSMVQESFGLSVSSLLAIITLHTTLLLHHIVPGWPAACDQGRLDFNLQRSTYICLLSTGIKGMPTRPSFPEIDVTLV